MSYATDDFTESLSRVPVEIGDIARVVAAWGHGEGMGEDAGHYRWSAEGASEWSGGFLCEMKGGGFVYIFGWCDYTGWGCQDGAYVCRFSTRPTYDEIAAAAKAEYEYHDGLPPEAEWDVEPADLNRWLDEAHVAASNG